MKCAILTGSPLWPAVHSAGGDPVVPDFFSGELEVGAVSERVRDAFEPLFSPGVVFCDERGTDGRFQSTSAMLAKIRACSRQVGLIPRIGGELSDQDPSSLTLLHGRLPARGRPDEVLCRFLVDFTLALVTGRQWNRAVRMEVEQGAVYQWEQVRELVKARGFPALLQHEQASYLAWCAYGVLGNGGFQYLFETCYGWASVAEIRSAFDRIGLEKLASLVASAAARFPGGAPPSSVELALPLAQCIEFDDLSRKTWAFPMWLVEQRCAAALAAGTPPRGADVA
jgi:hypothetical protein